MKKRLLEAKGKGEYTYDYSNDVLLFKIKDRDYKKSIDFENIVVDIDKEGFITGMRVFDASKIFKLTKMALKNIKQFEFNAKAEENVITIQLRFMAVLRNKPMIKHGQDFVREALDSNILDSEVLCSV
jgi:uncharacterized protein YuzE